MILFVLIIVDNLCVMKIEVLCLIVFFMVVRIVCKFDNKESRRGKKDLFIR